MYTYTHTYAHIHTQTATENSHLHGDAHTPVSEQWSQFLLPTKAVNLRSYSTVLQLCLGTRLGSTFSLG